MKRIKKKLRLGVVELTPGVPRSLLVFGQVRKPTSDVILNSVKLPILRKIEIEK